MSPSLLANVIMDQFYTKTKIASKFIDVLVKKIDLTDFDVLLEPSAGTGSFYKLLDKEKRQGLDIEPKCDGILKMHFLTFKPYISQKYITIGNPPFGRGCSQAVQFFNKAATFSDTIAFIIPRTFKRVSIQNKLNLNFHLVHSEDLPLKPCCFEPKMDAKCCFQIWVKKEKKRKKVRYPKTHTDFKFVHWGPLDQNNQPTPPTEADFALKAYGSNCGEIVQEGMEHLRPKSWHWIKCIREKDGVINQFESLNYEMSKDTVRQDSIGRKELVYYYNQSLNDDPNP